jgi:hypothetical protein
MVSKGAEAALRAVLRECGSVNVGIEGDVRLSPKGIGVGGATLRGSRWRSPKGLTARQIDAQLGEMSVATAPLLAFPPRIELGAVARGSATCLFDPTDFANFLTHPAVATAIGEHRLTRPTATVFSFGRGPAVTFDLDAGDAHFDGTFEAGRAFVATLSSPGDGKPAIVRATDRASLAPLDDLSSSLTSFFNELAVDLDGVTLRFRAFSIVPLERTRAMDLALGLDVRKLPSYPALKF